MTKPKTKATPSEPLRGEAAYRAQRAEIDKRNNQARARGAARREKIAVTHAETQRAAAKVDAANLPEQPQR